MRCGKPQELSQVASAESAKSVKKGKEVACQTLPGGVSPGVIGPPLIAMKARSPDRKRLFDRIYDATTFNANTRMPPFGKHDALTKVEIDDFVDYLYTH